MIYETPFLEDAVNEQARKIVDTGKSLLTLQGQYFHWQQCYDILSRTGTAVVLVRPLREHVPAGKYRRLQEGPRSSNRLAGVNQSIDYELHHKGSSGI